MCKKYRSYLVLFVLSVLLVSPLLAENMFVDGHDIKFHITNIKAVATLLSDSLFIPKVLPNIIGDLGYGSGIFYPRILHVTCAFLYNLTLSIPVSLTLFIFGTLFLAGIFMINFLKRIIKDEKSVILGAVLYVTSSYFLSNIYVRTALAESLIFIFVPLIFSGIYELFYGNKKKFYIFFVLGFVCMINSHLITAFYFAILLGIFLIVYQKLTFKYIKEFIIASVFVILFALPSLVPTFTHQFLGDYIVFADGVMGSNGWALNDALWGYEFFLPTSDPNNVNFVINYVAIIMVIASIYLFIKTKEIKKVDEEYTFKRGLIIFFACSLIFCTKLFPWYFVPHFMTLIQFPWRLNIFVAFSSSIVGLYSYLHFKSKVKYLFTILMSGILLFAFIFFNDSKVKVFEEDFSTSWGLGYQKEYLPVAMLNRYELLDDKENILKSNCDINYSIINNDFPNLKVDISSFGDDCVIELPKIYYLTYEVLYNEQVIDYYESKDGFIEFEFDGNGVYELVYKDHILTKIANIVFIMTFICAIILINIKKLSKIFRL